VCRSGVKGGIPGFFKESYIRNGNFPAFFLSYATIIWCATIIWYNDTDTVVKSYRIGARREVTSGKIRHWTGITEDMRDEWLAKKYLIRSRPMIFLANDKFDFYHENRRAASSTRHYADCGTYARFCINYGHAESHTFCAIARVKGAPPHARPAINRHAKIATP